MTTEFSLAAAPGALPLLGHIPQLLRRPLALFESLRACGDVVVMRIGTSPAYVVNHPDLIRRMLVADARKLDKGVQFEKVRPYVGNGVLTSSEPLHLRRRRTMQPAFHQARIAGFVEVMRGCAEATVGSWSAGQDVALDEALLEFTLKSLTRSLFSTELEPALVREFADALRALLDGLTVRVALPFRFFERLPLPGNRRFDAGRIRLAAIVERIVAAQRIRQGDRGDLLSMLVDATDDDAGAPITDQELRDEIMTMLVAGSETTANTLSWACHLLGEHAEVQARVRAEIDEVLAGRPVSVEALPRLTYTRQVLNETLRLYPPVWLVSRRPFADHEIGGHPIPAGSNVLFSPYALHRDPALYPAPDRFMPERWAEKHMDAKTGARGGFVPFGAGMRGCIGEPYAWSEMLVFLSTLLSRWRLAPTPGRPVRPIVKGSLQPDRLVMRMQPRPPTPTRGPRPEPA